ncbi:MAG TPA: hypothetical protein VEC38_03445 [Candidatus Binataceae bacterium]|nr:hypothetical protein [Candidatus Binataceae bacterium]
MRRLLGMAAFAAGFWYLWNATDAGENLYAVSLMGVGMLLEFMGAA